jgi:hypothetical protein
MSGPTLIQYQQGASENQEQKPADHGATARWVGGVQREVHTHSGEVVTTQHGVMRGDSTAIHTGSPFDGARDARTGRSQAAHEITENSIVKISGQGEQLVKHLLATGEAVRLPNGQIVPAGQSTSQAQTQQQQQPAPQQQQQPDASAEGDAAYVVRMDAESVKAVNDLVDVTSPDTHVKVIGDLLENDGILSEKLLASVAGELQTDPAEASAKIEAAKKSFQAVADKAIANVVDADGFAEAIYDHYKANDKKALDAAVHALTMDVTTKPFADLAKRYMMDLPKNNPDAIRGAEVGPGLSVEERGGAFFIRTKDGLTPWRAAVMSGLIRFKR